MTPWTAACQASLSITSSWNLPRLMSIKSVMPSNYHPLLSPSPPAFNLPSIRVFSSESILCIRWPKYWNFSFSISPFSEYSGWISFRMDWLNLLAVQGTLKSLLPELPQGVLKFTSCSSTELNLQMQMGNVLGEHRFAVDSQLV